MIFVWAKDTHKVFFDISDEWLMAMTVHLEAGGEARSGQEAVAQVIVNRIKDKHGRFGAGVKGVILRPWAFSCYNMDEYGKALKIAQGIIKSATPAYLFDFYPMVSSYLSGQKDSNDSLKGATHYFNPKLAKPKWKDSPLMEKVCQIGNHVFYVEHTHKKGDK